MLAIQQAGVLASIQDGGRRGLRRLGIPWAGVLVPPWMAIANALVGNARDHPVIECFEGGFVALVHDHDIRLAVAGDATATLTADGQKQTIACWRSHRISAGSRLEIRTTGQWRLAIIAIEHLAIEPHQGSCATYSRAGLGGLHGSPLQVGDQLPVESPADDGSSRRPEYRCEPFAPEDDQALTLHAVPGPQQDAFPPAALDRFFSSAYQLTADCDRMGARLEGRRLDHRSRAAADIVSDAIVPGSIQVPGSGQPIVLLADAHTAGGYPKIATVISADLAWLALYRPGSHVRFSRVTVADGISRARAARSTLQDHIDAIEEANDPRLDHAALLNCNLIDGVTDGS